MTDDAFIHIGFINNLIKGNGLGFAGKRTYGTTSPLWIFLAGFLSLFTHNTELSVRILSGLFTALSIVFFYFLLDKLKIKEPIKTAGLVSLGLNPFVLRWSLTGMESTAAMSFTIAFMLLLNKDYTFKRQVFTGILFGIACLLRPEFTGFLLITVVFFLFKHKADKQKFLFALPGLIILTGWILFTYFYFGYILPNTYTAKSSSHLISFDPQALYRDLQTLLVVNLPEFLFIGILIFILFLFIRIADRKKFFPSIICNNEQPSFCLIFLWLAVFYIFYIFRDVTILSRYALIFVPLLIFFVLNALNSALPLFSKKSRLAFLSAYFLIITVNFSFFTFKVIKPSADDFVNGFQTAYKHIALIIHSYSNNKDISVGVADVGIIGVFSNAKVYDTKGLVDNERFNYKSTLEYYLDKKPDFIILRGEENIKDVIPPGIKYKVLFRKQLPGFGIETPEKRTVSLYKIDWK